MIKQKISKKKKECDNEPLVGMKISPLSQSIFTFVLVNFWKLLVLLNKQ
jgi:hypothetical protein